jgi:methylenetetrahydrofolate--tRNA-(uracil-5-)-methyltransferase
MGLVAGRMAAAQRLGRRVEAPPATTALGALVNHITGGHVLGESGIEKRGSFQPMNVNYGLFPDIGPVDTRGPDGKRMKGTDRARARKRAMSVRALEDVTGWLRQQMAPEPAAS